MTDDFSDGVGVPGRDFADVREKLNELAGDLGRRRIVGRSQDGNVEATVDGNSTVVDIVISDSAIAYVDARRIGGEVIEAIAEARAEAAMSARSNIEGIVQHLAGHRPARSANDGEGRGW